MEYAAFLLWAGVAVMSARAARRERPARRRLHHVRSVVLATALAATAAAGGLQLATFVREPLIVSGRDVGIVVSGVVPALICVAVALLPGRDRTRGPAFVVAACAAAGGAAVGFLGPFFPPEPGVGTFLLMTAFVLLGAVLGLVALRRRERTASRARRVVRAVATVAVVGVVIGTTFTVSARSSRLPGTFDMMQGAADAGLDGGSHHGADHDHVGTSGGDTVSVTDLRGPRTTPDRRVALEADEVTAELTSGKVVEGWGFNGQVPGPELAFREGELVEVVLRNSLEDDPVTLHWHGVDVPNGEDGVAGVTQDAVAPGEELAYRFEVEETGTHWYHSHQQGSEQVTKGLFGALTLLGDETPVDHDIALPWHQWESESGTVGAFGLSDTLERRVALEGDTVRLRLTNTSDQTATFTVTGTPYRVTHADGEAIDEPGRLDDERLAIGAGGRLDVELTMPDTPVRVVNVDAPEAGLLLAPESAPVLEAETTGDELDLTAYGEAGPDPVRDTTSWDREFEVVLDEWLGFYDGHFAQRQTANGEAFPKTPMHVVAEGDMVRMRFVNRGSEDHPMHLHGHHMTVLSRNGTPATGSPLRLDTVLVRPGEVWEVGFEADNPGIWMDHCHNLLHASLGLVLHLAYEGVTTPFVVGGDAGNRPE